MAIDVNEEMRRLYQAWCLDSGTRPSTDSWLAFKGGWAEALLYAAKAREAEFRADKN